MSYDTAKRKNLTIFLLTWLILASLVTYTRLLTAYQKYQWYCILFYIHFIFNHNKLPYFNLYYKYTKSYCVLSIATVYCKLFKVEKFAVKEMNCNLLENICGCMVILHIGQGHYQ